MQKTKDTYSLDNVPKVLIVASTYYREIADKLILGAKYFFETNVTFISYHPMSDKHSSGKWITDIQVDFEVQEVPGTFEIPFIINKKKDKYDGFVALGCVIRGQTYHFEVICNEVTRKIMDLSIEINKPVGFGIIMCDNIKQAEERSKNPDDKRGVNKGVEAAKACQYLLYSETIRDLEINHPDKDN